MDWKIRFVLGFWAIDKMIAALIVGQRTNGLERRAN